MEEAVKAGLGLWGNTVMVVDDNKGDAFAAKLWLERLGCHVILAIDGEQALERAHEYQFDIILMDLDMPGSDGLEATKNIRGYEATRQAKPSLIIALSGSLEGGIQDCCYEAGMDDYLAKPVSPGELRTAMVYGLNARLS